MWMATPNEIIHQTKKWRSLAIFIIKSWTNLSKSSGPSISTAFKFLVAVAMLSIRCCRIVCQVDLLLFWQLATQRQQTTSSFFFKMKCAVVAHAFDPSPSFLGGSPPRRVEGVVGVVIIGHCAYRDYSYHTLQINNSEWISVTGKVSWRGCLYVPLRCSPMWPVNLNM